VVPYDDRTALAGFTSRAYHGAPLRGYM
jgi:hypothetical protein